jgi:hypothetical protein
VVAVVAVVVAVIVVVGDVESSSRLCRSRFVNGVTTVVHHSPEQKERKRL